MAKKKSTKEKKTNDERILDQHHIEYEEVSFDWINNGADALAEAKEQGVPAESILKTIVMQANNDAKDYVVVCLSLIHEIDLKLVAHELGKKQVHLADNKNLINITGYVHGQILQSASISEKDSPFILTNASRILMIFPFLPEKSDVPSD